MSAQDTAFHTIDEDTFIERFEPRPNHLEDDAPFDGCMFETYGEELAFVREQDLRCIWTIFDSDNGLMISSGYHFVNRFGYLVCNVPVEDGCTYFVELEDLTNHDADALS